MTAPLTPPDCDLRAFPTMPLDLVRLFGSEFHAVASDSAWRAGVTLWLRSWHQMPAASLPDDDVQLARLAELGRDVKGWKKLRAHALHGWVSCDDGRLYHPVIAAMATAAWEKRKAFKERSSKGNSKRWPSRKDGGSDPKAILEGDDKESSNDPKGEGEGEGEGNKEKKEGDAADAASSNFAFAGSIIRLSEIDLQRWRKAYHAIADLEAELTSLDAWLQGQPAVKAAKWFHTVSGSLNRKHQEILAGREPGRGEMPLV